MPQYCEIDTCSNAPTAWCDGCSFYVCGEHENACDCPNEPVKQHEQGETHPTQLAVLNNLAATMAISAQTQSDNAQRAVQQEKEQDEPASQESQSDFLSYSLALYVTLAVVTSSFSTV